LGALGLFLPFLSEGRAGGFCFGLLFPFFLGFGCCGFLVAGSLVLFLFLFFFLLVEGSQINKKQFHVVAFLLRQYFPSNYHNEKEKQNTFGCHEK
jgi:hypothetical protein